MINVIEKFFQNDMHSKLGINRVLHTYIYAYLIKETEREGERERGIKGNGNEKLHTEEI